MKDLRIAVKFYDLCKKQAAEIECLQAIVDRLPKTADGVPITLGITVYLSNDLPGYVVVRMGKTDELNLGITIEYSRYQYDHAPDDLYSTPEAAAEAAKENQG